ncbi:MAG: DUF805 domain-containing protein [Akkermansia muciniphila]|nr:DUF805 domain-containing protein [Akkermansia muciniphila]
MSTDAETRYFYLDAHRTPQGPCSLEELRAACLRGELTPETQVAAKGDPVWQPLGMLLQLPDSDLPPAPPAPEALPLESLGSCPVCGQPISPTSTPAVPLPAQCPHCKRALRAEQENALGYLRLLWAHGLSSSGRSRRAEFIAFHLFAFLTLIICGLIPPLAAVSPFLSLAFCIFCIPVTIRRMHDTGHSALAFWLNLVGSILVFLPLAILVFRYMIPVMHTMQEQAAAGYMPDEAELQRITEDSFSELYDLLRAHTQAVQLWAFACVAVAGLTLYVCIVCLLDSHAGPNQYGPSPKYPLGR